MTRNQTYVQKDAAGRLSKSKHTDGFTAIQRLIMAVFITISVSGVQAGSRPAKVELPSMRSCSPCGEFRGNPGEFYGRYGYGRDGYGWDGYDGRDAYGRGGYEGEAYGRGGYAPDEYSGGGYDGRDGHGRYIYRGDAYGRDGYGADRYSGDGYGRDAYGRSVYRGDAYSRGGGRSGWYGYGRDAYRRDGYGGGTYDQGGYGGGVDENGRVVPNRSRGYKRSKVPMCPCNQPAPQSRRPEPGRAAIAW